LLIGKIIANTTKRVLFKHWKAKDQETKTGKTLEKCEGCELDQVGEAKSCKKWNNRENVQGSIARLVRKGEEITLELDQEMINNPEKSRSFNLNPDEKPVIEVICEDLDIELIKKQRLSEKLKKELIGKFIKNQAENNEELIFYTDGSLKKISKDGLESDCMGAGWVQLNANEEEAIDKGAVGIRNWPSSTKAELWAIWCVLLIMPKFKKVKIYTDSAAAIAGLDKAKNFRTSKQSIREQNYNIKKSIQELVKTKGLELELVKVKGHNNNR